MNNVQLKANLIIPGAGKSGTSSLHGYLNQHPEICMSTVKEPQFFSIDETFAKGFEYYNSIFNCNKEAKYFGESSTTYLLSEVAIERIKKYVGQPRFIILLREPVAKIYSHYSWLCANNVEVLPLREALKADMNSTFDANKPLNGIGYKNYILSSMYGTLIERYYNAFGKENILIITTEKLSSDPLATLNDCFDFLKLKHLESIVEKRENITPIKKTEQIPLFIKKVLYTFPKSFRESIGLTRLTTKLFMRDYEVPKMSIEDKNWIKDLLSDDINNLKKVTGNNFSEWKNWL